MKKKEQDKPMANQTQPLEQPTQRTIKMPTTLEGLEVLKAFLHEQAQRLNLEFQLNRQNLADVERRISEAAKVVDTGDK